MFESTDRKYRATVAENGLLNVYQQGDRVATITSIGAGQISVSNVQQGDDSALGRLLMQLAAYPYFRAAYAGNRRYHLDLDCGAQRWQGEVSSAKMGSALSKCGFSHADRQLILEAARKHTHQYLGRVTA